ncbi:MAG: GerMN domain-containing protein [Treponema sp.]|jgi:hypothetical protein|nr:GerMN domain-containing protein [Treponema sp.]
MAARKGRRKAAGKTGKPHGRPVSVVFWIGLTIVIVIIIFKLMPEIQTGRKDVSRVLNPDVPAETTEAPPPPVPPPEPLTVSPPVQKPQAVQPPAPAPVKRPPEKPRTEKPVPPPANPKPPAAQPAAPPPPAAAKPAAQPVESRSRTVYFSRAGTDGEPIRAPAVRTIAVSSSPLLDSLNALLAGPSAEEQRRGMVSFIPPNSGILSLTVQGSTAYINFNENFQFNTYGREGYTAQIAQVVWTATEFSTVKDVQIVIEGRRIDFLCEGLWIGSPVGRDIQLNW